MYCLGKQKTTISKNKSRRFPFLKYGYNLFFIIGTIASSKLQLLIHCTLFNSLIYSVICFVLLRSETKYFKPVKSILKQTCYTFKSSKAECFAFYRKIECTSKIGVFVNTN